MQGILFYGELGCNVLNDVCDDINRYLLVFR